MQDQRIPTLNGGVVLRARDGRFCQAEDAVSRFMARVSPEPNTGCWLWTGAPDKDGYGKFQFHKKTVRAHRFAYEAFVGPLDPDLLLRHRCDVGACVNPDHLQPGTQLDNIHDAIGRGRRPVGERHHAARITAETARGILEAAGSGERISAVARRFGVSLNHAWLIRERRIWKSLSVSPVSA
jgi:hypothetical protein